MRQRQERVELLLEAAVAGVVGAEAPLEVPVGALGTGQRRSQPLAGRRTAVVACGSARSGQLRQVIDSIIDRRVLANAAAGEPARDEAGGREDEQHDDAGHTRSPASARRMNAAHSSWSTGRLRKNPWA